MVEVNNAGGIVGGAYTATIQDSCNIGTIEAEADVGGIIGAAGNGIIKRCYNEGSITGKDHVGGIVGAADGVIENCYNIGSIKGNTNIGGIKGYSAMKIKNSYNVGLIEGNEYVGAIVGNAFGQDRDNCYYNSTTSGVTDSYATGKTIEEMKKPSFVETLGTENWKEDTSNINNGYPILKWQQGNETVIIQEQVVTESSIKVNLASTNTEYKYYQVILKQAESVIIDEKVEKNTEYTFTNLNEGTEYVIEAYAYKTEEYLEDDRIEGSLITQTTINVPIVTANMPTVGETAIFNIDNIEEYSEGTTISWYRNQNNTTEGSTLIEGEAESLYEESASNVVLYENYYYYCQIQTASGEIIQSQPVKLKVNYEITTSTQLGKMRDLVNSGTLSESVSGLIGKTVTLGADINLNPGFTFKEDGTYEVDSTVTTKTEPQQWIPIGNLTNRYLGSFDGNSHTISGIYINTEENYQGLFGYTNTNISNLKITHSYIKRKCICRRNSWI